MSGPQTQCKNPTIKTIEWVFLEDGCAFKLYRNYDRTETFPPGEKGAPKIQDVNKVTGLGKQVIDSVKNC